MCIDIDVKIEQLYRLPATQTIISVHLLVKVQLVSTGSAWPLLFLHPRVQLGTFPTIFPSSRIDIALLLITLLRSRRSNFCHSRSMELETTDGRDSSRYWVTEQNTCQLWQALSKAANIFHRTVQVPLPGPAPRPQQQRGGPDGLPAADLPAVPRAGRLHGAHHARGQPHRGRGRGARQDRLRGLVVRQANRSALNIFQRTTNIFWKLCRYLKYFSK